MRVEQFEKQVVGVEITCDICTSVIDEKNVAKTFTPNGSSYYDDKEMDICKSCFECLPQGMINCPRLSLTETMGYIIDCFSSEVRNNVRIKKPDLNKGIYAMWAGYDSPRRWITKHDTVTDLVKHVNGTDNEGPYDLLDILFDGQPQGAIKRTIIELDKKKWC